MRCAPRSEAVHRGGSNCLGQGHVSWPCPFSVEDAATRAEPALARARRYAWRICGRVRNHAHDTLIGPQPHGWGEFPPLHQAADPSCWPLRGAKEIDVLCDDSGIDGRERCAIVLACAALQTAH